MTSAQVKEARRLLGWTASRLNVFCGFPDGVVQQYEKNGHIRQAYKPTGSVDRQMAMRSALEAVGVVFTDGDAPDVKLRKPTL